MSSLTTATLTEVSSAMGASAARDRIRRYTIARTKARMINTLAARTRGMPVASPKSSAGTAAARRANISTVAAIVHLLPPLRGVLLLAAHQRVLALRNPSKLRPGPVLWTCCGASLAAPALEDLVGFEAPSDDLVLRACLRAAFVTHGPCPKQQISASGPCKLRRRRRRRTRAKKIVAGHVHRNLARRARRAGPWHCGALSASGHSKQGSPSRRASSRLYGA